MLVFFTVRHICNAVIISFSIWCDRLCGETHNELKVAEWITMFCCIWAMLAYSTLYCMVVMAALRSRCRHYIFALWFLSVFLFFIPRLISAVRDWMSTILDTWCGPSANLECRSEMCCTRLAANAGRKKVPKNHHLGTIAQLCWAISSQLRYVSIIGKKNLLSSNISSTCPHNMVNFDLLAAEIVSLVWGTPSNFNGFRVLFVYVWIIATYTTQHLLYIVNLERNQLILVCNLVKNQQTLILFSLLDCKVNGICESMKFTHLSNYCRYSTMWKSKHRKCNIAVGYYERKLYQMYHT